jgi:hypothetical protein
MFAEARRRTTRIALLTGAIALIFIILPTTPADSAAKRRVTRIKFATGVTSARVKGRLRGQDDVVRYVLRVRAGQRMQIKVESEQLGNPQIDVTFPSGKGMDRDMQGTQFDTESTEAGDYRINVYEGRKADPSAGIFYLEIEVN